MIIERKYQLLLGNSQQFAYTLTGETMSDIYKEVLKRISKYNIHSKRPVRRCFCPKGYPEGTIMVKIAGYTRICITKHGKGKVESIAVPLIPV